MEGRRTRAGVLGTPAAPSIPFRDPRRARIFLARRAENAGVQLITIHGRTRMQFYEGKADWDAIRAVRDEISVPLIANGDVETAEDVQDILRRSGADAVMIGRGAQGRPWHPGVLAGHAVPGFSEIAEIALEHYAMMLEFYGEGSGLRHARKHLGWYLERFAPDLALTDKVTIMTSKNPGEVADLVRRAFAAPAQTREAA